MQTKYVRTHSGLFAIFGAGLGLQHREMAYHLEDARSVRDAGFVECDPYENEFCVYGRSLTLGLGCNRDSEKDMKSALKSGNLRLYALDGGVFATNAELTGDYEIVQSADELFNRRVFYRS
jgi:hypothetical protein